ncbi:MAG: alpha-ketoglutarate-dependent dioxygenase AlkB family protein [Rudaea sp.]
MQWRHIELAGADVRLARFCTAGQASAWFARLQQEIPWQRHRVKLFGRELEVPRLACWMGDAGAVYSYSRMRYVPQPWTRAMAQLRTQVSALCGEIYNGVLCNLYRNGRDAMGWHSDDEPELGQHPRIASLSFGAPRRFCLRHRRERDRRVEIVLESGDLLLMAAATQANYQHALPRTRACAVPRINLTFRPIRESVDET